MKLLQKGYCRAYQAVFRAALPVLPYRNPHISTHMADIPVLLRRNGAQKPLVITDQGLAAIGAPAPLCAALQQAGVPYVLFDQAFPNPTTQLARQAAGVYRANGCDSIIAFGGGSPMDLAKAVGVCIARPNARLEQLRGLLKVHCRLPLLVAVPTTAGTGSETTLAAVLVDKANHHKFTINDFALIPPYAVLDHSTIHTLPTALAATTGLDALTHAVEAYIGRSTTWETRADAERAVYLIFRNLDDAACHRSGEAERRMLIAAHYAGRAFTRSYVGYVHALSHSLSGRYDLPHGWTNAVILPLVLRRYGAVVHPQLARLARRAGLGRAGWSDARLAEAFICAIEAKNAQYGVPAHIGAIRPQDIPMLARHAAQEANPLYPVPVLWDAKELEQVYREVKG